MSEMDKSVKGKLYKLKWHEGDYSFHHIEATEQDLHELGWVRRVDFLKDPVPRMKEDMSGIRFFDALHAGWFDDDLRELGWVKADKKKKSGWGCQGDNGETRSMPE